MNPADRASRLFFFSESLCRHCSISWDVVVVEQPFCVKLRVVKNIKETHRGDDERGTSHERMNWSWRVLFLQFAIRMSEDVSWCPKDPAWSIFVLPSSALPRGLWGAWVRELFPSGMDGREWVEALEDMGSWACDCKKSDWCKLEPLRAFVPWQSTVGGRADLIKRWSASFKDDQTPFFVFNFHMPSHTHQDGSTAPIHHHPLFAQRLCLWLPSTQLFHRAEPLYPLEAHQTRQVRSNRSATLSGPADRIALLQAEKHESNPSTLKMSQFSETLDLKSASGWNKFNLSICGVDFDRTTYKELRTLIKDPQWYDQATETKDSGFAQRWVPLRSIW